MGLPLRLKTDAPTEGVDETGAWRDLGEFGPATGLVTIDADAASAGIAAAADVTVETSEDGVTAVSPSVSVSMDASPHLRRSRMLLQRYVRYTTTSTTPAGAYSSLTTALAGTNNDLTFTAKRKGVAGDSIRVRYVDPGAPDAALSVVVAGTDITVNLATDGTSVITTTAADIAAAIAASLDANALVGVANAGGNDGTGLVIALAYTPLSGGVDPARFAVGVTLDLPLTD